MSIETRALLALVVALVAPSTAAFGQGPARATFTVAPVEQFESDLDSGGQVGYGGVYTALGLDWVLDAGSTLGVALKYDYEDWHFSGFDAFGGAKPWGRLYRYGVSVPYRVAGDGGWSFVFSPTVEYSGESGAAFSDSLEYGALVSAGRRMGTDLTLGLGVGVYDRIDQVRAFPFLVVDWRIGERWRLTNPLSAGPAGPAGLELSYALGSGWEMGLAAAYRSFRFRLDNGGPAPGGIGQNRYFPVVARLGRQLAGGFDISLYAGFSMAGSLRLEDASGQCLYDEDRDPAALVGLALQGRFR